MTALVFNHVTKLYSGASVPALRELNLSVPRGSRMGIIGRSGAGKSTLVRLMSGLEVPDAGEVLLHGQSLSRLTASERRERQSRIGLVFQHFNLLAQRTALGNVMLPLELAGVPLQQRRDRAQILLEQVGLSQWANRYPAQLSGGQKQRVGIARALATNPDLLLADEATSALDPETSASILELLIRLQQERDLTLVIVTHQLEVVRAATTHIAVLESGELIETGSTQQVLSAPQHPVTKALLEAHQPRSVLSSNEELRRIEATQLSSDLLQEIIRVGGRIVQVQPQPTGVEVWIAIDRYAPALSTEVFLEAAQ